jgi:DNA (cytosine-5)-methyltransferase 1
LSAPYTESIETWDEEDFNEDGELTATAKKKHKVIIGTKGWVFLTILNSLWELGYNVQWQLLNSKYHGVPQNRERVFIIANLRGTSRPKVFPIGEDSKEINGIQGLTVGSITARRGNAKADGDYVIESNRETPQLIFKGGVMGDKNQMWLENGKEFSRNFPQGQRVYDINGISAQLTAQGGGWGAKTGLYEIPEIAGALDANYSKGNCGNVGIARTTIPEGFNIRRLTPIECERLQGFPDNWTKYGIDDKGKQVEISDTQRYKCLGNAVTTNVIRDIVSKWNKSL